MLAASFIAISAGRLVDLASVDLLALSLSSGRRLLCSFLIMILLKKVLWLANSDFLVLLVHLIDVALQLLRDVDAEHKDLVTMGDVDVTRRVGVDIRVKVVVGGALESIESKTNQLLAKKEMEQIFKCLVHTFPWHWYLPQVALSKIRVSLHGLS